MGFAYFDRISVQVGLAVDDIKEVQDHAELEALAMQVNSIPNCKEKDYSSGRQPSALVPLVTRKMIFYGTPQLYMT